MWQSRGASCFYAQEFGRFRYLQQELPAKNLRGTSLVKLIVLPMEYWNNHALLMTQMVWLDIEGPQYWSSSVSANRNFFNGLVSELEKEGQVIGVYTSQSQWIPIMGDWAGGSKFPLWYAHYDGVKSFGDFSPFAGWSKPNMKQYAGDATLCSAGVDLTWYP